ncbi:MAG: endonuclease [Paludibacter sp.]|nr:endonuclease [Paludibacter sp.]
MKKLLLLLLALPVLMLAQPKAGYYDAAVGKTDAILKTSLYNIISAGYSTKSYDYLYTIYQTSDITADGKVWDMYSTCTWTPGQKKCGSYSNVCDCYNREHSIPQSWFNEASPMKSDAFHVYPTDGKVNGQRSNYPFGECSGGTTLSGGKGRLGKSTFSGYSGTVFEPVDEYKGDFARTYFYFATRYENIMTSIGGDSFSGNKYPALSAWSQELFLKWHRQDPVSEKERARNNAVEAHQKNRNPFIDYPMLAEHIWGNKKDVPWSFTSGVDALKIEFSIGPNPVQNKLNIRTDEHDMTCSIFDLNGRLLMEKSLPGTTELAVDMLENGMYLIKLTKGERNSIQKFIISK